MTRTRALEDRLAVLLRNGTWLASVVIALGLVLAWIDSCLGVRHLAIVPDRQLVKMGIALFILLPQFRVLLMLFVFIRQRDFRLAFIAGIVLAMILLGMLAGYTVHPLAG